MFGFVIFELGVSFSDFFEMGLPLLKWLEASVKMSLLVFKNGLGLLVLWY